VCYICILIVSFADRESIEIWEGIRSKKARKRLPIQLWPIASRKLDYIDSAKFLKDLEVPPGNRLEKLKGDREGQYSIRINQQYRICFDWVAGQVENLEIVDYH